MRDHPVTLAAVIGAHGVAGEVRLKLFAESLESLKRHRHFDAGDRPLTLVSVRAGVQPIACFAEVVGRDAAEALRGATLTVPRSALPPLAAGEYYHADLVGLSCTDEAGRPLGTVVSVANFGAGDLLEVANSEGRRSLVPLRAGIADLRDDAIVLDPAFLA